MSEQVNSTDTNSPALASKYASAIKKFFGALETQYGWRGPMGIKARSFPIILGEYVAGEGKPWYYNENRNNIDLLLMIEEDEPTRDRLHQELKQACMVYHEIRYDNSPKYYLSNLENLALGKAHAVSLYGIKQGRVDVYKDAPELLSRIGFSESQIAFLKILRNNKTRKDFHAELVRMLRAGEVTYPLSISFLQRLVYFTTIDYSYEKISSDTYAAEGAIFFPKYLNDSPLVYSIEYLQKFFREKQLRKGSFYALLRTKPLDTGQPETGVLIWIKPNSDLKPLRVIDGISYRREKDSNGKYLRFKSTYTNNQLNERTFLYRIIYMADKINSEWLFFYATDGLPDLLFSPRHFLKTDPLANVFIEDTKERPVHIEYEVRKWWKEMGMENSPATSTWSSSDWIMEYLTTQYPEPVFKVDYPEQHYHFRRSTMLNDAIDAFKEMASRTSNPKLKRFYLQEARKMRKDEYIYIHKGKEVQWITKRDSQRKDNNIITEEQYKKEQRYIVVGYDGVNLILYGPEKLNNDPYKIIAVDSDHFIIRSVERRFFRELGELEIYILIIGLFFLAVALAPFLLPVLIKTLSVSYLTTKLALEKAKDVAKQKVAELGTTTIRKMLGVILLVAFLNGSNKRAHYLLGFATGFTTKAFSQFAANIVDTANLKKLIPYYGWIRLTRFSVAAVQYIDRVSEAFQSLSETTRKKIIIQLKEVAITFAKLILLVLLLAIYYELSKLVFEKGSIAISKWREARKKLFERLWQDLQQNPQDYQTEWTLLAHLDDLQTNVFEVLEEDVLEPILEEFNEEGVSGLSNQVLQLLKQNLDPDNLRLSNEKVQELGTLTGKLAGMIYIRFMKVNRIREKVVNEISFLDKLKYWTNPFSSLETELNWNADQYLKSTMSIPNMFKVAFEGVLFFGRELLQQGLQQVKTQMSTEINELKIRLQPLIDQGERLDNILDYMFEDANLPALTAKFLLAIKNDLVQSGQTNINLNAIPSLQEAYDGRFNMSQESKLLTFTLGMHVLLIIRRMKGTYKALIEPLGVLAENEELTLRKLFSVFSLQEFADKDVEDQIVNKNLFKFSNDELANLRSFLRRQGGQSNDS